MFNFNKIGEKIKILALVLCAIGMYFVIELGIEIIDSGEVAAGIECIIFGVIISWVSVFFIYGFGELITKTIENASSTKKITEILIELKESKEILTKQEDVKNVIKKTTQETRQDILNLEDYFKNADKPEVIHTKSDNN